MPVDTIIGNCCCGSGIPAATCCIVQPETLLLDLSGLGLIWNFQSIGVFNPCTQVDVSNLNGGYTLTRVGDNIYSGSTDLSGGDPPYGTPIVTITVNCLEPEGFPIFWAITLAISFWGVAGDDQIFRATTYNNFCEPTIMNFTGFLQDTFTLNNFDCIAMTVANPYWQDLYAGWTAEVYE